MGLVKKGLGLAVRVYSPEQQSINTNCTRHTKRIASTHFPVSGGFQLRFLFCGFVVAIFEAMDERAFSRSPSSSACVTMSSSSESASVFGAARSLPFGEEADVVVAIMVVVEVCWENLTRLSHALKSLYLGKAGRRELLRTERCVVEHNS